MANKPLTLADIPYDKAHIAQQVAFVRLQLFVIGEVHRLLLDVASASREPLKGLPRGEPISFATATLVLTAAQKAWDEFIKKYTLVLGVGMRIAASLPFGVWAVQHAHFIKSPLTESLRPKDGRLFLEAGTNPDAVFKPQLDLIIDAAYQRTEQDGLKLSNRIWNLDNYGRVGLNNAINTAMQNGDGAWELAQTIEGFLGPGQNCPRWTKDRLNGLTKADIASGDRTGLFSGDECRGQGVSYNALRLARTEMSAVLSIATDKQFAAVPWIEGEKVNLNTGHVGTDECDSVATGGANNDGTYPKGTITLPLHPHCMCFKTSTLGDPMAFVQRLKGWNMGDGTWPQMDQYASMWGGQEQMTAVNLQDSQIGVSLAYWSWSDYVELGALFWRMAQGWE